ncbi:MAG: energy transducer TonB, partial [Bacteroidetes bacterium]|nr:energy transducer TonB [Bacteroidota bacterium]MBU1761526.1 energy transducer TonB [Bacteroidota bacterium]
HKFPINGSRFISLTIPKFEKKLETSLIITKRLKSEVPNQISIECKNTQSFNHRFSEYTASYPGGNDNFTESLKKNIKYPIAAIKSNIEGEVVIRFTVDSLGKVINPTIIKGIGYGCEKEVINQLSKLQKWHPAVNNNSRINQDFILTYIFKLED